MFVYMTGIIISIVIMTLLDYSEFGILFGVLVGSFCYIVYLIEEFFEIYETGGYVTFRVKEDEGDEE